MSSLHPGVTFYEDDRGNGPFVIRIGGTREFVSGIDKDCPRSWPPGHVDLCEGWDNPSSLRYDTMNEALTAADLVWNIEGYHTSIERAEWTETSVQ